MEKHRTLESLRRQKRIIALELGECLGDRAGPGDERDLARLRAALAEISTRIREARPAAL